MLEQDSSYWPQPVKSADLRLRTTAV